MLSGKVYIYNISEANDSVRTITIMPSKEVLNQGMPLDSLSTVYARML